MAQPMVEQPYYQLISKEMTRLSEAMENFAEDSEEYQAYDDMVQALWDTWCDKQKDRR
jgi:hypothetical protein